MLYLLFVKSVALKCIFKIIVRIARALISHQQEKKVLVNLFLFQRTFQNN